MKFSDHRLCSDLNLSWKKQYFSLLGIDFSINLSEMVNLNFNKKLLEIQNDLRSWSRRNLTVLGKITVIKSCILSKLVHLFLVLPSPPPDFLQLLERVCFKFIWDGKNDKISRNLLIQDYDMGGCKMVHIKSFIKSLKISWLKKLISSDFEMWQNILFENSTLKPHNNLVHFGNKFFDLCSKNIQNLFWKEVFSISSELIRNNLVKTANLPYEPLWYNSNISIDRKPVFYKSWYMRNIVYIYDLLDEDGYLMSYDLFCTKYGFSPPFTEFYGLKNSMRAFLDDSKNNSFSVILPTPPQFFADILFCQKPNKIIYKQLVKIFYTKPLFETKWETKLDFLPCENWWRKAHLNSIIFTIETKLKWFQIRLTHRLISTNTFLLKIGVATSHLCTFCKKVPEDLIHIYWLCKATKLFWTSVESWYLQKCNVSLNLNSTEVIFGKFDAKIILNLFLVLAKYHIYTSRLKNTFPIPANPWNQKIGRFLRKKQNMWVVSYFIC